MPQVRTRTRRRGMIGEEARPGEPSADKTGPAEQSREVPTYARGQGAVVALPLLDRAVQAEPAPNQPEEVREEEPAGGQEPVATEEEGSAPEAEPVSQAVTPVSDVSGTGEELHSTAYGVTLRGRTDADFHSSFATQNVVT